MAFDKAKIVRAAEKYLAQGKIPLAIKEYRQIVDNEPDDFTALNMLGDLYVRQNDKQEAMQCFLRIAEHYREEGFQGKAIAMYKKIDRLNPRSPEIANKLALLYESQGLIVDARAQYMVVADAWLKDGQARKALEIFRKVADLDPHNTEARLKLAESYRSEGLLEEAATAHAEAGTQFLTSGKYERALEAFTAALEIRPLDYTSLNGYLDVHIARGTPDEAAEVLERALAEKPEDLELLSMLADAYLKAEDAPASERVVNNIFKTDASNYLRFIDVAQLYLRSGKVDDTVRILSIITEQLLAGHEEEKLMELLNEALARDPEHIEALRLLVRVYAWQRDDDKQRQALERLVEATEAAGLEDVERSALLQLAQFSPDQKYLERLATLGHPQAAEPAPEDDVPTSTPEDVPSFESFSLIDDPVAVQHPESIPIDEVAEFPFSTAPQQSVPDPAASFADLNEDWQSGAVEQPVTDFHEFDFGGQETPPTPTEHGGSATPAATLDEKREALLRQELDSVDFYLTQGYMDIAADTLDMLERQFGAHPEIDSRRSKVSELITENPVAVPDDAVKLESFTRYDIAEEVPSIEAEPERVDEALAETGGQPSVPSMPANQSQSATTEPKPGIDPGLQAIFEEFRTAAEEEEPPETDGDYETRYNLGIAYKEMELFDEAVEEFQIAAAKTSPNDGTARYLQCCNMLGHCFLLKNMPRLAVMWFMKGLQAPGHSEDEYQALRYDLGSAYEQMGDLDKAIDVFSEVYGVNISYRGVGDKLRELQAQKSVNSKS